VTQLVTQLLLCARLGAIASPLLAGCWDRIVPRSLACQSRSLNAAGTLADVGRLVAMLPVP
jgi:hypothetical protein